MRFSRTLPLPKKMPPSRMRLRSAPMYMLKSGPMPVGFSSWIDPRKTIGVLSSSVMRWQPITFAAAKAAVISRSIMPSTSSTDRSETLFRITSGIML